MWDIKQVQKSEPRESTDLTRMNTTSANGCSDRIVFGRKWHRIPFLTSKIRGQRKIRKSMFSALQRSILFSFSFFISIDCGCFYFIFHLLIVCSQNVAPESHCENLWWLLIKPQKKVATTQRMSTSNYLKVQHQFSDNCQANIEWAMLDAEKAKLCIFIALFWIKICE